jgi:hypothetical protein
MKTSCLSGDHLLNIACFIHNPLSREHLSHLNKNIMQFLELDNYKTLFYIYEMASFFVHFFEHVIIFH